MQDNDSKKGAKLLDYIAQLREWLSLFLAANMDMTASLIGHNMLLEQVGRYVCLYLANSMSLAVYVANMLLKIIVLYEVVTVVTEFL